MKLNRSNSPKSCQANIDGFTLVEILAVLAIIAVLASLSIPKFIILSDKAELESIRLAIRKLNSREILVWGKISISDAGWISDETLFLHVDTDLGDKYIWLATPETNGATLRFGKQMIKLNRIVSTEKSAGHWTIAFSSVY